MQTPRCLAPALLVIAAEAAPTEVASNQWVMFRITHHKNNKSTP